MQNCILTATLHCTVNYRKKPILCSETAEVFRKWCRGALAKRGTFVYDQNQTILCRSRAERKILKMWNLYNVGNGLYGVFTTAKRALILSSKRGRLFKKYFFRSLTGAL